MQLRNGRCSRHERSARLLQVVKAEPADLTAGITGAPNHNNTAEFLIFTRQAGEDGNCSEFPNSSTGELERQTMGLNRAKST